MHNSQQWSSDAFIRGSRASFVRLLNPCLLEHLLIASMGNAEAVPKQKLTSSAETSDKVLPTDKNTTVRLCDTSTPNRTNANNEIETIDGFDETMPREKTDQTNGNNPKPTYSTSTTFSNR